MNKTASQLADEFIANPRRLAMAHALLSLVTAFAYWTRPGTFTPHLPVHVSRDVKPIVLTSIAWLPYLISAIVSRRILGVRDKKAAILFICLATAITGLSVPLYLNWHVIKGTLSPIVVSVGVTVLLLLACGLCALIWLNDAPD
jgi:putative effector of murein hydrolase